MTRKRVCILRRAYYPAESHVRRNAETLIDAGYDVTILCLQNDWELSYETISGVEIYRLPLKARRSGLIIYLLEYLVFFFLVLFFLSWFEIKSHFDFIEVDSMPNFLVFAALLPRIRGTRVVLYMFESMPELWMQKMDVKQGNLTIRLLILEERISCSFANTIISCHEFAKQSLIERGVSESKIVTILNVPDEKIIKSTGYRLSNPPHTGLYLIQHGTITENYGIQIVIKALASLDGSLPIHYDVVGSGEYESELKQMVNSLRLENVTFHGYVSRDLLFDLLNRADIGIVPMLFEYQSPNKLFEFVALGKPVIASDRKTFRQHFDDDEILFFKTGDSQDLAKAIESAYYDSETSKARKRRASQRYDKYSWEKMQKRYLDIYSDLVLD